jgi:peptidyl-prolyl cis-trans isomerase B (cyclophilin B)
MGSYQPYPPQDPRLAVPPPPSDQGGFGWGVLGFFIPIVGLVLFLVWRQAKPKTAKAVGVGALVGAVLEVGAAIAAVLVFLVLPGANETTAPGVAPAAPASQSAQTSPEPQPTAPAAPPDYSEAPDPALAEGREWAGSMETSVGVVEFTLDGAAAPQAVANFIQLAGDGYYDGSSCHRLTTEGIFVLQCGSLTGDGTDGPGYQFGPLENVPEDDVFPPGTIAMARAAAEDSQGSQFFITYQESTIPGGYSVFGHVTSGLEAVEGVAASGTEDGGSDGRPAIAVTIDGIELQ